MYNQSLKFNDVNVGVRSAAYLHIIKHLEQDINLISHLGRQSSDASVLTSVAAAATTTTL